MDKVNSIHPSYYFYTFIVGLLIGIISGFVSNLLIPVILGLFVVTILILITIFNKKWRFLTIILIGLFIGFIRVNPINQDKIILNQLIDKTIVLKGTLSDNPSQNQSKSYSLRLINLEIDGRKIAGKILATTRQTNAKRGDQILLIGQAKVGLGGYNLLIKDANIKLLKLNQKFLIKFQNWLSIRLKTHLSIRNGQLIDALLLGRRRQITNQDDIKIRTVGLSHIIVVSGLHLMIIIGLLRHLNGLIHRRITYLLCLLVALFFAVMTGLSASMVRATVLLFFSLSAWLVGRKFTPWRIFSLILTISLLINPFYLLPDLSWLLSYGAFAGILIFAPVLKQYFFGKKKLNYILDLSITLLAIQLILTPILVMTFGSLSLITLVSNIIVVPIIGWVMSLGLIKIILNFAFLGQILSWCLNYIWGVIDLLASMPLASVELTISNWIWLVYYLILAGFYGYFKFQVKKDIMLINETNFKSSANA